MPSSGVTPRVAFVTAAGSSTARSAAERELARLVVTQEDEPEVVSDETARRWPPAATVNDAIAGWRANGWDDLSPVTVRRYEDVWKRHSARGIGKRRIATLTPYDVENYFRQMKARGAGRKTVRYVRSMLHRACKLARKWSGNQLHNPVAHTVLPSWGLAGTPERCVRRPSRSSTRCSRRQRPSTCATR